jgi:ribosome-associated translation inhibitor RaiA
MDGGAAVALNQEAGMKIDIRFRGFEVSQSLREYIVRRAHFAFRRFGRGINSLTVRISDINGPKGGADKRCQVTIRGSGLGTVTLEDLSADAYSAVDMVFERAARVAGREIERTRADRRDAAAVRRAS